MGKTSYPFKTPLGLGRHMVVEIIHLVRKPSIKESKGFEKIFLVDDQEDYAFSISKGESFTVDQYRVKFSDSEFEILNQDRESVVKIQLLE